MICSVLMSNFTGVVFPVERVRITMPFSADWTKWYSKESPHRGVDLAPWPGSEGRPVRAPFTGVVTHVGDHEYAGKELVISGVVPYKWGAHDLTGRYHEWPANREFHVRMTHHHEILVNPGAVVTAGELVARIGMTGKWVTGPHVHLEIRLGKYEDRFVVDPMHFFVAAIPGLREVIQNP